MTYEVIKYIKGNPYRYLVRSEREGDRVRQVFVRYLGRADKPSREYLETEPVEREVRERPVARAVVSEAVAPAVEAETPTPVKPMPIEEITPLVTTTLEVTKEPWQMTQTEFFATPEGKPTKQFPINVKHRASVEKALAEGKPVPPEVLKDYPELAPKPTPEVMVTPIEPEITPVPPSNPYMNMPIERVRRDAQHGVLLAKEALAIREAVTPEVTPVTTEAKPVSEEESLVGLTKEDIEAMRPMSEELKALHLHPERANRLQGNLGSVGDYLDRIEKLMEREVPSKLSVITKAKELYGEGNRREALFKSEEALWELHKVEAPETARKITPVTPEVTKEPWQMTREEYVTSRKGRGTEEELKAAWHSAVYQAQIQGKEVPKAITAQAEELARKVSIRPEPQAWEMSWQDWAKQRSIPYETPYDAKIAKKTHEGLVREALAEDKPVSYQVLRDYPDLAKAIPKAEPEVTPVTPEVTIEKLFSEAKNAGVKVEAFDIQSAERKAGYTFKVIAPDGREFPVRNNAEGLQRIQDLAIPKAELVTPEVTVPADIIEKYKSGTVLTTKQFAIIPENATTEDLEFSIQYYNKMLVERLKAYPDVSIDEQARVLGKIRLSEEELTRRGKAIPKAEAITPEVREANAKRINFLKARLAEAEKFEPIKPPKLPTEAERAGDIEDALQDVADAQENLNQAITEKADASDIADLRNGLASAKDNLREARKPFDKVAYDKAVAKAKAEDEAIPIQVERLKSEIAALEAKVTPTAPAVEPVTPEITGKLVSRSYRTPVGIVVDYGIQIGDTVYEPRASAVSPLGVSEAKKGWQDVSEEARQNYIPWEKKKGAFGNRARKIADIEKRWDEIIAKGKTSQERGKEQLASYESYMKRRAEAEQQYSLKSADLSVGMTLEDMATGRKEVITKIIDGGVYARPENEPTQSGGKIGDKGEVKGYRLAIQKVLPTSETKAAPEIAKPIEKPIAPAKMTKKGKKLLSASQISDFRVGIDKVVREGDRTFVIDTEGVRKKIEVQSDVITPQFTENRAKLTPEQNLKMIETIKTTPYLSDEGRAERLAVIKTEELAIPKAEVGMPEVTKEVVTPTAPEILPVTTEVTKEIIITRDKIYPKPARPGFSWVWSYTVKSPGEFDASGTASEVRAIAKRRSLKTGLPIIDKTKIEVALPKAEAGIPEITKEVVTPTAPAVETTPSIQELQYSRDLDIRNIEALPKGTGAKYLITLKGQGDELIAKQWARVKPASLKPDEVLVSMTPPVL